MKSISKFSSILLALAATSCGEGKVQASSLIEGAKEAAEGGLDQLDLTNLAPAALKTKASEILDGLSSSLAGIKGQVDAREVSSRFTPLVEQLARVKDELGAKLPGLDAVREQVSKLQERFAGNGSVLQTLKPLLDGLRPLLEPNDNR